MNDQLPDNKLMQAYEAGLAATQLAEVLSEERLLAEGLICDLNAIGRSEDVAAAVQSLNPVTLYRSFAFYGLQEHLCLLAMVSAEQFTGLLDISAWETDEHHERLSLSLSLPWLEALGQAGPEVLYEHFSGLGEELQLGLLGPYIRLYNEEEFEKLGEAQQDTLVALPCQTLYYQILSDDQRVVDGIQGLIGACLANNIPYAYALLGHAAYTPPQEQEQLALQFRNARLEDEGFSSKAEGMDFFRPQTLPVTWTAALSRLAAGGKEGLDRELSAGAGATVPLDGTTFFDRLLDTARGRLSPEEMDVVLARFRSAINALAPACGVGIGDFAEFRRLVRQFHCVMSLGLEYFSSADLDRAVWVLRDVFPKTLFQAVADLYREPRRAALEVLSESFGLPASLTEDLRLLKYGKLLWGLDLDLAARLDPVQTEALKGFFNRFPLSAAALPEGRLEMRSVGSVSAMADQLYQVSLILARALLVAAEGGRPVIGTLDEGMRAIAGIGHAKDPGHIVDGERLAARLREELAPWHRRWDMLLAAGIGDCSERVYRDLAAEIARWASGAAPSGGEEGA